MLAQPRGGTPSGTAAEESVVAFALQHLLLYVWGLAADVFVFTSTILWALLAIVGTFIVRRGWVADVIGRLWSRGIVRACGIQLEVDGLEYLTPGQSYVLIIDHLSKFDIWCTLARMPFTVCFVAKQELLRLPVFGQALAASEHIVIDRKHPQAAIQRINAAACHTPGGVGILFYAEGTRSRDGKVHEFKKGGVSLALNTHLPIVPLSISGTRKFLPRGCAVIRPGG
ncbi:MAG: lysophospholipid acyltransferase family protein, partial [bacterium]